MVKLRKQISLILILSLFLSLIPNFLYNGSREVFASDECGDTSLCPEECTGGAVYDENSETCVCIDCSFSCPWGGELVTNKSCLPLSETGEWDCGMEIPIGEVVDGTTILAEKMLVESLGIIQGGKQMVDKTDELLTVYKDWECSKDWCQTGCYKFYHIAAGESQGEDPRCPPDAQSVPRGIYAGDECQANASQCKSCDDCGDRCCWSERYCWDSEKEEIVSCPTEPEKGIETLNCQYYKKEGSDPDTGEPYCREMCSPYSCWGCCEQYFNPILDGFELITGFQGELENDIDEKYSDEEGTRANLPPDFKLKRSYILEQLEFSRCELAQCWMSAEDYPAVFAGEKVGKHLLTCEAVSQMEFLEEDQINCNTLRIKKEWEVVETIWEKLGVEEHWWKWLIPGYAYEKFVKWSVMKIVGLIEERSNIGQEEGCYPHNYYCCQK